MNNNGSMTTKQIKSNVVLIGMAGAGKSTVGDALATLLGLKFADVDSLIEADQKTSLQQIVGDLGVAGFRKLEEKVILSLDYSRHVLATGGSAIYSQAGMNHLKQSGVLVLLDVSLAIVTERVGDFSRRGLVKSADQSLEELFLERHPLYRGHADCIVNCNDRSVAEICSSIRNALEETFYHF